MKELLTLSAVVQESSNLGPWIAVAAAVAVAGIAAFFAIKFYRASDKERAEMVENFIVFCIKVAEKHFTGSGRGAEKLAWVEKAIKDTFPATWETLLESEGVSSLEELINEYVFALELDGTLEEKEAESEDSDEVNE